MNEAYDVIIAGASIPGLCLANYLARKGFKILIIDLKSIKRIGESVSGKIISDDTVLFLKNSFNIRIPVQFIEKKVQTTSITSINGVSMNINTPYYILDKKKFSAYLLGKIIDSDNVTIMDRHTVVNFIQEGRSYKGVNVQDMGRSVIRKVYARIIVDSTGPTSILRRKLPQNRFFNSEVEDFDRAVIYEEVLELDEKVKNPKIFFDPSKLGAGYVWVIPESDNKVCVGIGVAGKSTNIKKTYSDYKRKVLGDKKTRLISSGTGLIPMRRPLNSFVYKNIVLIGSSACQVNPLVVRDISYGIRGAYSAGKAIKSALKKDIINTKALWDYNSNFMRSNGARCALLEGVRDFFVSLSTPTFEYIINNDIINPELVKTIGGRLRKRDLITHATKLLLKPRLLSKFIKLSNYSSNAKRFYDNYPVYEDFAAWKKNLNNELVEIRKSFLV
jgi:flavin-dependent dehydrogenase